MCVSIFTVSNSQRLRPLRCSMRLLKVAASPLPMQLVAVNCASSNGAAAILTAMPSVR